MEPASAILSILETVYNAIGLAGIIRYLKATSSKEQIQAALDAEYAAADAVADKAEDEKLGS